MALRIISHGDVETLQAKVKGELGQLDATYLTCVTKLDQSTKDSWAAQRKIATDWLAQTPVIITNPLTWTGPDNSTLYSQGIGIESVLRLNWYPRFQSEGCSSVPTPPPPPEEPALSTSNASSPLAFLAEIPPMVMVVAFVLLARQFR